jgi:hypothetical protein
MSFLVKDDGQIYCCRAELMWTKEEVDDEEKRKCRACQKICQVVFIRVFNTNTVHNFCSKVCYDKML